MGAVGGIGFLEMHRSVLYSYSIHSEIVVLQPATAVCYSKPDMFVTFQSPRVIISCQEGKDEWDINGIHGKIRCAS